jgi:hypothetical protein
MPDFGSPVADQITPPNPSQGLQTLSGVLGIAQQQQALQQGQQQLDIGQSNVQSAQQQMNERLLLQKTMQTGKDPDGNSIKNPDGSFNTTALTAFANKSLPMTGQDVVQKIVKTQDDQIGVQGAALALTGQERNLVSNVLQSAAASADPVGAASSGLAQLSSMSPQMDAFVKVQAPFVPHLQAMNPQQQKQALITAAQQYAPPEATRAATAPQIGTVTGPGGGVQAVQTNPLSPVGMGAVGPETAQGIPLTERQTLGVNPTTNGPTLVSRNGQGQIVSITNPPTQGVYVPQPGDAQALPVLQGERDAARQQYSAAALQHTNNQIVLQNIDNVAATGPLGERARNLLSAYGVNANSDAATAYDLVGKGLERSALQAAQTMGPQTNAGLEAQVKANGSLAYTPAAIKQITRLNDAITSGVQAYQPGLERAIAANPSMGVFAKRQFDEQWGANFDPRIFEMYNAAKSGDQQTLSGIVSSLGGKDSPQFKALMQKAAVLNQLSNGGSAQ